MGLSAFGRPDFRSFPVVFKRREKDEKIFVLENFLLFLTGKSFPKKFIFPLVRLRWITRCDKEDRLYWHMAEKRLNAPVD